MNPHKTNWFKKLLQGGKLPRIELVLEFDNIEDLKLFEIDYIKENKEKYNLINLTKGGDTLGDRVWSREAIIKKSNTRPIVLYNILREKIAEYEIMEDAGRALELKDKACSHITQCCKGIRKHAYSYIWRYKGDPLGDISDINPKSLSFNYLVQYDLKGNRLKEYDLAKDAAKALNLKSPSNIYCILTGGQNTMGGYYWLIEPRYVYFDQKLFDEVYNKRVKNQNLNNTGKEVICMDLNGNELNTYPSMLDAAEKVYGNRNRRKLISECLKGVINEYKGYKWKRVS